MNYKTLTNIGIVATLAFVLSACGKSDSKKGSGNSGQGTEVNRTINGEKPETYYNRFLYKHSGTCMNYIYHKRLTSYVNNISLDATSNGNKVVGEIDVYLEKDAYIAKYREVEIVKTDGTTSYTNTLLEKDVEGEWYVDGMHIKLEGLGTGFGIKYNGRNSLMLSLDGPINSGLKSKDVLLSYVTGTHGLESMRGLCPNNYKLGTFSVLDSERNLPTYPLVALKATLPDFAQDGSTMYISLFIFDDESFIYNYTYKSNGERFSGKESGFWRNRGDEYLELVGLGKLKIGPHQSGYLEFTEGFWVSHEFNWNRDRELDVKGEVRQVFGSADQRDRSELLD